jgi:hypothetical protein
VTSKTVSESSTGRNGKGMISRGLPCSISRMQGPNPKCPLCTRAGGRRQPNVTWILRQRWDSDRIARLHNPQTCDNVFQVMGHPLRQWWGRVL